MRTRVWSLILGGVMLALGLALSANSGKAADAKKVRATILKAAELLQKGDEAAAKKEIATLAKDKDVALDDVMETLKLRTSKGLGVGKEPIKGVADGIESLIGNLEKRVPPAKVLEDHNADIARAAYISAVIGELVKERSPVAKKTGDKDPADWKKWSEEMYKQSIELADAVKAKKAPEIKAAAKKLNNTCLACHGPFKKN
jgi:cytochrome c'